MSRHSVVSEDISSTRSARALSHSGCVVHVDADSVTKVSRGGELQDGTRLQKQAEKQKLFHMFAKDVDGISCPQVFSIVEAESDMGVGAELQMEKIPFDKVVDVLSQVSLTELDWLWVRIKQYLIKAMEFSEKNWGSKTFGELLPALDEKVGGIVNSLRSGHGYLWRQETEDIGNMLTSTMSKLRAHKAWYDIKVPVGFCHGDLNFANMILDRQKQVLYVFDFLDSFVESPMQDFASLRQDIEYGWFILKTKNFHNRELLRARQVMKWFENNLTKTFEHERWWPLTDVFLLFKLARILPYCSSRELSETVLFACTRANHVLLAKLGENGAAVNTRGLPSPRCGRLVIDPKVPNTLDSQEGVTLVVPAGGRSSRFSTRQPKWLLTMPSGRLMLVESLLKLDHTNTGRVIIGLLCEHINAFCSGDSDSIFRCFDGTTLEKRVSIVILEEPTQDQVETVEIILETAHVVGPIFIKDCDNEFDCAIEVADSVALMQINRNNEAKIFNVASKSYVQMGFIPDTNGEWGIINIMEKVIVSDTFCVGGYSFHDSQKFLEAASQCRRHLEPDKDFGPKVECERAVSDCIWQLILDGESFGARMVTTYEDWGTSQAFRQYQESFRTIFCDIDGVIVKHSGQFFIPRWCTTEGVHENVVTLNKLYETGRSHIILTTTRTEAFRSETLRQLKRIGLQFHSLLMGLPHCRQYLINGFASANPYPSAVAINLERDSEGLEARLGL